MTKHSEFKELTLLISADTDNDIDTDTDDDIKECVQEVKINGRIIATATDNEGHEVSYIEEQNQFGNKFHFYMKNKDLFSVNAKNFNEYYCIAGNALLKLIKLLKEQYGFALELGSEFGYEWNSRTVKPAECVLSDNQHIINRQDDSSDIQFRSVCLAGNSSAPFDLRVTEIGEALIIRNDFIDGHYRCRVFNLNQCVAQGINFEDAMNVNAEEQLEWEQIKAVLDAIF